MKQKKTNSIETKSNTNAIEAKVTNTKKETKEMTQTSSYKPEVFLTETQYKKLNANDLFEMLASRISQENAQKILPQLIEDERLEINDASTIMNWTYKRITVQDVEYKGRGTKNPSHILTQEEFSKLSGKDLADMIRGNISVEKSKAILLVLIQNGIITPTVVELRDWTYNRVLVEGIDPIWNHGTSSGGQSKIQVSIAGVVAK